MHIPDGYLSPATCAALYASAAPFWYVALRRVRRLLHTRLVPQLSVFAAFSFVLMMFNLPLPGGTTGHAVGAGIAAIVLGPWGSMLAISVALLIQAVFFGDGGITTFGANAFNMAVVGSLVAYGVYRALAGRAALDSPRRVFAAALAGYAAINASALCAAFEFGNVAVTLFILRATQLLEPGRPHTSAVQLALGLYVAYNVAATVVSVPAGRIGDRKGSTLVLASGIALFGASYVGFAIGGTTVLALAPAFLLSGVAIGCVETSQNAAVASVAPTELRGSAFGVFAGIQSFGNLAASAVAGILWTAISPATAFAYLAVWMVIALVALRGVRSRS